ncbi:MAG: hypothetical protein RH917_09255 [Lacipirellulaceae bacterium]
MTAATILMPLVFILLGVAILYHVLRWLTGTPMSAGVLGRIAAAALGMSAIVGTSGLWYFSGEYHGATSAGVKRQSRPLTNTAEMAQIYNEVLVNPSTVIAAQDDPLQKSNVEIAPAEDEEAAVTYSNAAGAAPTYVSTSTRFSFGFLLLFPLALIVLFALWRHFGKEEEHADDRPSAWGTVGSVLGLLLIGSVFFWLSASRTSQRVVQEARAVADTQMATARAAQAQGAAAVASIDELHEELTKPRIQLEEPNDKANDKAEEASAAETAPNAKKTDEEDQPVTAEPPAAPPSWVTNPPKRTGNVTRRVVSAGPFKTTSDCYRQIERKLEEAVVVHLQELVRSQPAFNQGHVSNLRRYNITPQTILRVLCPPDGEYIEVLDTSVGEMKTLHVLMEFGPEQNAFLLNQWRDYERLDRIFGVTAFAGLTLAIIAGVWGLLWLDTFTRGYYTKRLFLGVPAAIIGGICLIGLIAENM